MDNINRNNLLSSLVDYVNDVKPYHVKIKSLSNELQFSDSFILIATDEHRIDVYLQDIWTTLDVGGYYLYTISEGLEADRYFRIPATIFPRFSLNDHVPGQTPPGDDPASLSMDDSTNNGIPDAEQPWTGGITSSHFSGGDHLPVKAKIISSDVYIHPGSTSFVLGVYYYTFDMIFTIDREPAVRYGFGQSFPTDYKIYISAASGQPNAGEYVDVTSSVAYIDGNTFEVMNLAGSYVPNAEDLQVLPPPSSFNYDLFCRFGELQNQNEPQFFWTFTGRFAVPYHEGSRVYRNQVLQTFGTNYIVDSSRTWIQFLDSYFTFPTTGDQIDVNLMKCDRLFIAFNDPYCAGVNRAFDQEGYDLLPYGIDQASVHTINSLTQIANLATATVPANYNMVTGNYVTITGANQVDYNGTFQITVQSPTQFTFYVLNNPISPATGSSLIYMMDDVDKYTITIDDAYTSRVRPIEFYDARPGLNLSHPTLRVTGVNPGTLSGNVYVVSAIAQWALEVQRVKVAGVPELNGPKWTCTIKAPFDNGELSFIIESGWSSFYFSPDPNSYLTQIGPLSISSINRVSDIATVILAQPTKTLRAGQILTISGATPTSYNGEFEITVVNSSTFTYRVNSDAAASATGTMYASAQLDPTHFFVNLLVETEHGVVTDPNPPIHAPVTMMYSSTVPLGIITKVSEYNPATETNEDYYQFVMSEIPPFGSYIELRIEQQNQYNPWAEFSLSECLQIVDINHDTETIHVGPPWDFFAAPTPAP